MKTFWFILSMCLGIFLIIGISMAFAEEEVGVTTADTDFELCDVELIIPQVANLEVVPGTADSSKILAKDLGGAEAEYDQHHTDLPDNTPTLKVSANQSWQLSAKSSGFGGVPWAKPVGELKLKHKGLYPANSFSGFISLDTQDKIIATNTIGVWDEPYQCQYRITLDWTLDVPGTYTATVTYTLATIAG